MGLILVLNVTSSRITMKISLNLLFALFVTTSLQAQLIDDFSSNTVTWTEHPTIGLWEIGSPTNGFPVLVEDQKVLATNLNGPYDTEQDVYIESSELLVPDLPNGSSNVYLEFLHRTDLNTLAYLYVQIVDVADNNRVSSLWSQNWTSPKAWSYQTTDVSAYAGKAVKIRFQLDVYSSYINSSHLGVYVDQIRFRTSDEPEGGPILLTIQDIGVLPDSSTTQEFQFDLKLDAQEVNFNVSSSNDQLLPADSIEITTEDNQNYTISVAPISGQTGTSTITVMAVNGIHETVADFNVYVYDRKVAVLEDFESNKLNWKEEPSNSFLWQVGKVLNGPGQGFQSERALGTNLAENYDPFRGRTGSMVSSTIRLPEIQDGTYSLSFNEYQDLESCCGDYARVIVRSGNGQETVLRETKWRENSGWRTSSFSLAKYEGEEIQLVFELFMYGSSGRRSSSHSGWFIDNVTVGVFSEGTNVEHQLKINTVNGVIIGAKREVKVPIKVFASGEGDVSLTAHTIDLNPIWDGGVQVKGDGQNNWLVTVDVQRQGSSSVQLIAEQGDLRDTVEFMISHLESSVKRDSLALMDVFNALGNASELLNWHVSPMKIWNSVSLNDSGRVIGLSLLGGLKGGVSESIGLLDSLKDLAITAREITGRLPNEIGDLINLETLRISQSRVFGEIPNSIGKLNKLRQLSIGQTSLEGELPQELGDLGNLEDFILSWGDFTSAYPGQLFNCTKLKTLSTAVTSFYGEFPQGISKLTDLQTINMWGGRLRGPVSNEITALTKLTELGLVGNSFSSLPEGMGNMGSLESMNLVFNVIDHLPTDFGELPKLKTINLELNRIDNDDLLILAEVDSLEVLHVGSTNIKGTLPSELAQLTKLRSLLIRNTEIDSIPESFSQAASLESLSADRCLLDYVPDFSASPNMRSLTVNNNHLGFLDLEKNRSIEYFNYADQLVLNETVSISGVSNSEFSLNSNVSGNYNNYKWFKDEVELVGEVGSSIHFVNLTLENAGLYWCSVTNDTIDDLTIESSRFHLFVNEEPNASPVLNDTTITTELLGYSNILELPEHDADGDLISYTLSGSTYFSIQDGHFLYLGYSGGIYLPTTNLKITANDGKGGEAVSSVTLVWQGLEQGTRILTRPFYFEVSEAALPGEAFAQVYTFDESNTQLTYEIYSNSFNGGVFVIDSTSGEISLAPNSYLDYERRYNYNLNVNVKNELGQAGSIAVQIRVVKDAFDLCNFNPVVQSEAFTVKENIEIGATIGQISASDLDLHSLDFRFVQDDVPFFVNDFGVITLTSALEFDLDSLYELEVQVVDKNGGNGYADITIRVEEVPVGIVAEDQFFSVDENSPLGFQVGELIASELSGEEVTLELLDPLNTIPFDFENEASATLVITDSAEVDYELNEQFVFTVRVTALNDLIKDIVVTIDVINDPADIVLSLENPLYESVSVYPSLFNGQFTISSTSSDTKYYRLFSTQGKEVISGQFKGRSHQVQTRDIPTGAYHLEVMEGEFVASYKLFSGLE